MSNKCCSGDGAGRKDKGSGGGARSKTSCMRCNRPYSNIHTQVCHTGMSQALQVPNVTKNLSMTVEIKRRTLHALKGVNNIISKQKRLDNIARLKLLRTPCWRKHFLRRRMILHTLCQTIYVPYSETHNHFFTASNGSSHVAPSATPATQNQG